MIDGLRPYPTYRESGVEWLGEVPDHWEVRRLKSWLHINRQVLPEQADPEYTFDYLDIGSVAHGHIVVKPARIRFGNSPSRARRIVQSGDTLVSTVRPYLKAVWHCEEPWPDLVASTGFAVLTPRPGTFARFVSYFCRSDPFTNRVTADSVGVAYPAISEGNLGELEVCAPPVQEQAAIARFLDDADRRIRRAIAAKKKRIALLEEEKQATIQQAVAGQIDVRTRKPYRAYKDSGVEWLGKVPERWECRRLKTLLQPVDRRSVDGSETLLSLRRDHGVVIYAEHFSRPPQAASLVGFKLVVPEQLVVNRLQANNGLVFRSARAGLVSPDYSVFERTTQVHTQYLSDLLRTVPYRAHFRRQATGLGTGTAGFLRIYDDGFLATPIALPSTEEQAAIVAYVDHAVARAETLADRAERQVKLIRDYRIRLIADVVTGKLDVREAAAKLPDAASE